ncbi:MAG: lipid II flippase MurJ [Dehalococcoidia bacterium]
MTATVPTASATSATPSAPGRSTVARDSLTVSAWSAVSRATGLVRMVVAGAVLGPTFLANIYSSTNLLPTLLYQMMAGPLIAAMLVPPLVRHFDLGDTKSASRLANASFSLIMTGFLVAVLLAFVASPVIVRLLVIGIPTEARGDAQWAAWFLLLMVAPQVMMYGITGVATAVQQSRGRFAFPAAAQVIENFCVIGVLVVAARLYPSAVTVTEADTRFLLLIGLGTTAATAVHATAQWLGARAAGLTLRAQFHWRDPEVREIASLALPSIGTAAIGTGRFFALVVVAGLVPGGVIAMQLGVQFSTLPIALGARPISQALLPRLSRLRNAGDPRAFLEYRAAIGMALWIGVPAAIGLVVLSGPLANAVALGEMNNDRGRDLIRVAVAAFGLTVAGLSVVEVARQAAYSSRDALGPFQIAMFRTVLAIPTFAIAAVMADGANMLLVLGIGSAIADVISATLLDRRIKGGASDGGNLMRWLARDFIIASIAVGIAWVTQAVIASVAPDGRIGMTLALLVASGLGLVIYVVAQLVVGSPEFDTLGKMPKLPFGRRRSEAPTT